MEESGVPPLAGGDPLEAGGDPDGESTGDDPGLPPGGSPLPLGGFGGGVAPAGSGLVSRGVKGFKGTALDEDGPGPEPEPDAAADAAADADADAADEPPELPPLFLLPSRAPSTSVSTGGSSSVTACVVLVLSSTMAPPCARLLRVTSSSLSGPRGGIGAGRPSFAELHASANTPMPANAPRPAWVMSSR